MAYVLFVLAFLAFNCDVKAFQQPLDVIFAQTYWLYHKLSLFAVILEVYPQWLSAAYEALDVFFFYRLFSKQGYAFIRDFYTFFIHYVHLMAAAGFEPALLSTKVEIKRYERFSPRQPLSVVHLSFTLRRFEFHASEFHAS